jgi:sugar/nucleoside kinase (ribokinase family)
MKALFWGRSVCDLTFLLDEYPVENDKMFSKDFILQPGGPALNAAVTFAKHSGKAFLISRIGSSEFGKIVTGSLIKENIELFDLSDNDNFELPISTVLVNSKNSSRTVVNSLKPPNSINLNKEKIIKIIDEVNPQIILIDGFELGNSYEILEYAKNKSIKIICDGGSWKENTKEYLKYIDVAICGDRFRYPGLSLDETIIKLHKHGIKYIAFTQEENPIISSIENKREFIPVEKIDAVDTLGAGDVFHGAFCFYYSKSEDFNYSLKEASKDASNSCLYFGTHTWWDKKS